MLTIAAAYSLSLATLSVCHQTPFLMACFIMLLQIIYRSSTSHLPFAKLILKSSIAQIPQAICISCGHILLVSGLNGLVSSYGIVLSGILTSVYPLLVADLKSAPRNTQQYIAVPFLLLSLSPILVYQSILFSIFVILGILLIHSPLSIRNRLIRVTPTRKRSSKSDGADSNQTSAASQIQSLFLAFLFSIPFIFIDLIRILNTPMLAPSILAFLLLIPCSVVWSSVFFEADVEKKYFLGRTCVSIAIAIAISLIKNNAYYLISTFFSCCFLLIGSLLIAAGNDLQNSYGDLLPSYLTSLSQPGIDSSKYKYYNIYKLIMSDKDTRRILVFLMINFAFMFVEIIYGIASNSLGLISDAAHMLFDCTALVIGLYASYVSKLEPDSSFTYGYGRYETLAGFVNGVFLVLIGISVLVESLERVLDPPEIQSDRLLTVSVLGLVVNFIGIVFFHEAHAHSHGGGSHGHSHGSDEAHYQNMEGIFLHIVADALGSIGVIISSLLIEYLGWTIADPICSIIISGLILLSVYPLVKDTSVILLQYTDIRQERVSRQLLNKVAQLKGVIGYRQAHIWPFTPSQMIATLHVHIENNTSERQILDQITQIFSSEHPQLQICIQVEKKEFIEQLPSQQRLQYKMHDASQNDEDHV